MHTRPDQPTHCAELERLLLLHAWEETEPAERSVIEKHLRECPSCAARYARETEMRAALARTERPAEKLDASGLLLAQCRSELGEALDDAAAARARKGWWATLNPAGWLAPSLSRHPAWSAALLILLGLALGSGLPRWYRTGMEPAADGRVVVSASPPLSDQDLQTMGIAGINWTSDTSAASPSVELHLTAEKPLVVRGSLDDSDVKRVLTYVIRNSQRFDSGVRLDSVDVLRTRSADQEVRGALCAAARKDGNPGVRLKALEALRGFEQDDQVRQTLLDALLSDSNPGVRVEAINALRAVAEKEARSDDQRLVSVLRDRMQRDPNNYVRMQCAAAIRGLSPRATY